MRLILVVVIFVLGVSCAAPVWGEELTAKNFAMAAQYSRNHGGVALRVEQGGRLLYESYAPGWSASTPHKIYSGTKSFVAVAALVAEREGLLTLDEKASDTLTEWRGDGRRSITIGQLLSHTSGLDPDGDLIYPYRDQMAAAVRVHLVAAPGSQFHYGAVNYQAFGELLRRKLLPKHESVEDYIKDKVLDPLDIDLDSWVRDDAGHVLIHSGMLLSSEEWAKFGRFIDESLAGRGRTMSCCSLVPCLMTGHRANPAYGFGFWLNRPPPEPRLQSIKILQMAIDGDQLYPDGPRDLIAAIGTDKQRLYMIPSLDLVVTRFAYETRFSDGDFLSRLLTGKAHPDAHTH